MTDHTFISAEEAADRLAIRELVDAYVHCADRCEARPAEGARHGGHPLRRLYGQASRQEISAAD
jgi:hypothetical protein